MERNRKLQRVYVDYPNHLARICAYRPCSLIFKEDKLGSKICIRDCQFLYRNSLFCVVWHRTHTIFFALPLFLLCGILFLYEAWHNHDDILQIPNVLQVALLSLYGLYPLVSVIFGNSFPQMVTYIMPCPIISLSIVVYAGYQRKSKLLIFLMTIWGLTGIKSLFFNAYEDLILLACGIYGIMMFTTEVKRSKKKQ